MQAPAQPGEASLCSWVWWWASAAAGG